MNTGCDAYFMLPGGCIRIHLTMDNEKPLCFFSIDTEDQSGIRLQSDDLKMILQTADRLMECFNHVHLNQEALP